MSDDRTEGVGERDPRVYLAVERTLLSWIRTGLALMGFGFVVARFGWFLRTIADRPDALPIEHERPMFWFGTSLILAGVIVQLLASRQYMTTVERLKRGEGLRIVSISTGVVLAVLLALLGVAMTVYLLIIG